MSGLHGARKETNMVIMHPVTAVLSDQLYDASVSFQLHPQHALFSFSSFLSTWHSRANRFVLYSDREVAQLRDRQDASRVSIRATCHEDCVTLNSK